MGNGLGRAPSPRGHMLKVIGARVDGPIRKGMTLLTTNGRILGMISTHFFFFSLEHSHLESTQNLSQLTWDMLGIFVSKKSPPIHFPRKKIRTSFYCHCLVSWIQSNTSNTSFISEKVLKWLCAIVSSSKPENIRMQYVVGGRKSILSWKNFLAQKNVSVRSFLSKNNY